jgi:hypothetical protein
MAWLSEPLTSAGFLVVAFDHHGNSFVDGHLAEGFARWWERPLDLAFALDRLAERIVLGPVGAAGFSLGGYSAAALLGARVDADLYAALLSGALRVPPPPEYPELERELRARLSEDDIAAWVADAGRDYSDGRAQAAPNGSAPTHTPGPRRFERDPDRLQRPPHRHVDQIRLGGVETAGESPGRGLRATPALELNRLVDVAEHFALGLGHRHRFLLVSWALDFRSSGRAWNLPSTISSCASRSPTAKERSKGR